LGSVASTTWAFKFYIRILNFVTNWIQPVSTSLITYWSSFWWYGMVTVVWAKLWFRSVPHSGSLNVHARCLAAPLSLRLTCVGALLVKPPSSLLQPCSFRLFSFPFVHLGARPSLLTGCIESGSKFLVNWFPKEN